MTKDKAVELQSDFIVLAIPSQTVEVTIQAKVWLDGEVKEVTRTLPFEEVREAIKEAQECYVPSDAVFTLTDLGREELEHLKARYADLGEI